MHSMTGYGRGTANRGGMSLTAEVKTVNHRYLDVSVRLPKALMPLEVALRKQLTECFSRGRVELTISQDLSGAQATMVRANLPLAADYAKVAAQVAEAAGTKGKIKLSDLLALPEVLSLMPLDIEAQALLALAQEATGLACEAAQADRQREGAQLRGFFQERLDLMDQALLDLQQVATQQPAQARERLDKRLASMPDLQMDPARLAQEIALFADRCDISEEISRLTAHCKQLRQMLTRTDALGREMDFLAQEMNREANTICSKSASLAVTRLGLALKGEADKIREQIQNVE